MSRINTNISSLVAQNTLRRSNEALSTSLLRLSTGLRINVGKDDPAGLIASEVLRAEIVSVEKAITNSERANQLIATADSALSQVSSLLNDIRGLVSESANTGALSQDQLNANQLQIDSSLESIDRIARVTSFQGRRLLDGSLGFIHTDAGSIENIAATGTIGDNFTGSFAAATVGSGSGSIALSAISAGAGGNGVSVELVAGGVDGSESASFSSGVITVSISTGSSSVSEVITAINAISSASGISAALGTSGVATEALASGALTGTTSGGAGGNQFTISTVSGGATLSGVTVQFASGGTAGSEDVTYDSTNKTLTITIDDDSVSGSTALNVIAAINAVSSATGFSAAVLSGNTGSGTLGAGTLATTATTSGGYSDPNLANIQIDQANFGTLSAFGVDVEIDTQATQAQLIYSGGTLSGDLSLELGGSVGFEVFNFGANTTISQIANAVNSVSDSTGVSAVVSGSNLVLTSKEYGSAEFVSVNGTGASFDTVDTDGTSSTRENGTDVVTRVNGIQTTGDGRRASINTSTLDLSFTVSERLSSGTSLSFTITGGGANFQLGPEVVSNQQARIGISSVGTATLQGDSGRLSDLRSGGSKDISTDTTLAAKVVDEVITQITQLRGRLGAFQKTTLETNIFSLNDTLVNLTDAESSIRDADFAFETARLTRAQILVQSGTAVLSIANSNPQNVLALLG